MHSDQSGPFLRKVNLVMSEQRQAHAGGHLQQLFLWAQALPPSHPILWDLLNMDTWATGWDLYSSTSGWVA